MRFVILRHHAPSGPHFDFMLQRGGVLATWSLRKPPEVGTEQLVDKLPDHRIAYLDYEGPISGGRGTVARWDRGDYEEAAWDADRIVVMLRGEKLMCRATLDRVPEEPIRWRVTFA